MQCLVIPPHESFLTKPTFEWFLSTVFPHVMLLKMLVMGKCLVTVTAVQQWLCVMVTHFVRQSVVALCKYFVTNPALEWTFSSVGPHVSVPV